MADGLIANRLDFTGFQPEAANKVRRLLVVLERINSHPFLSGRVCLHGGTALNLFFLNVPRLSVDIATIPLHCGKCKTYERCDDKIGIRAGFGFAPEIFDPPSIPVLA
jgi:hypothetical protein